MYEELIFARRSDTLNLEEASMRNMTMGKEIKGPTLPPDLLAIMESGGVLEQLKAEKGRAT